MTGVFFVTEIRCEQDEFAAAAVACGAMRASCYGGFLKIYDQVALFARHSDATQAGYDATMFSERKFKVLSTVAWTSGGCIVAPDGNWYRRR